MSEFLKCTAGYRSLLQEGGLCKFHVYPNIYLQLPKADLPDIVKFKLAAISIEKAVLGSMYSIAPPNYLHGWMIPQVQVGSNEQYCIITTPAQMKKIRSDYADAYVEHELSDRDLETYEVYIHQQRSYQQQQQNYQNYAQQMNQTYQQMQAFQNQYNQQAGSLAQYAQHVTSPPVPPPNWYPVQQATSGYAQSGLGNSLNGLVGNISTNPYITTTSTGSSLMGPSVWTQV